MKHLGLVILTAQILATAPSSAALSIAAGTTGPLTFDAQPTVADGWSTVNVAGDHFSYQDAATLDAAAQGMDASAVNLALGSSGTVPPSTANIARWNSSSRYIQTRPTGIAYLALLATLQNDAGDVINTLTVTYDFSGTTASEDPGLAGHRVYYSLTGAPGSWTLIPELSGDTFGTRTVTLNTGSWAAGASLYLLWIDDNGAGGSDGYYTMDNVTFTALVGAGALTNLDPSSPADSTAAEGSRVAFGVVIGGTAPVYQWYKDNTLIPSATNISYVISNVVPPNAGNYFCIATNNFGALTSRVAVLTVNPDVTAPVVQSVIPVDATHLRIILSEGIAVTTATNLSNYTLQTLGGGALAIVSASVVASNQVELTLAEPRQAGTDYRLTVQGLQDLAFTPNTMATHIEILPAGRIGPLTFDLLPTVTDGWSTLNVAGNGDSIASADALDAAVQSVAASAINTPLGQSATVPPSTANIARWNSNAHFIETRPTGNSHILLLATIQNNSGAAVTALNVAYDLGSDQAITEEILGYRTYFSLTGDAGTWQVIPAFCTGTTGCLSADLNLGAWPAGAPLYVLWADDNSTAGTDGSFNIDNVVFTPAVISGPLTNLNASSPADQAVDEYSRIDLTFQVAGSAPSYQWYKNGVAVNAATTGALTLASASPADAGSYYCIAQNSFNSITSRVASVSINPDEVKPAVASVQGAGVSQINVVFSEGVNPATATNLANYRLETLAGAPIAISSASLTNNVVSLMLAAARDYGVESLLTVRGVEDLAYAPNDMLSQTELVPAEYNQPVFAIDQTWLYNTNGTDLGTAWKEEVYDTTGWLSGQGILGREDSAATLTHYASIGESIRTIFTEYSQSTITYYFRTTFVVTGDSAGLGLAAYGYIDDGAVFWLNGQEAGVLNMTTGGTNLYNTPATATMGTGTTPNTSEIMSKTIQLDGRHLHPGTNVLAVEVHQVNTGSSDIILGVGLNLVIPAPVTITTQPVGTNLLEGQTLTLTVGTSGSLLNYQWFQNGAPVTNGSAATLSLPLATTNASGNYYVVVTNGSSAVTSAVVAVSVTRDTVPPRIFYAMMNTNSINTTNGAVCLLTVYFTEPVLEADATNTANYFVVRELDGNTNTPLGIFVGGATLANGTNLTVQLSPKNDINVQNYRLYIGNIHDVSPSANLLATTNLLTYQRYLLLPASGPGGAGWKYDNNGTDLGTAWRAANYNDASFQGPMPGPFYTENAPRATLPATWGQAWFPFTPSQTVTTYYYRTTPFALPTGPSGAVIDPAGMQLQMELLINDGAVFWLNGVELRNNANDNNNPGGRYYMTNGTEDVRATTQAAFHEGGLSRRTPLYPINLLKSNVLAVEVHQSGRDLTNAEPTHLFAMQLIATYPPLGQPVRPAFFFAPASVTTNLNSAVTLSAFADGTLPMTVRWFFNTNTLVQTTTVSTRTTNLLTLALPSVQGTNEGAYFLVASNSAGVITSAVANLTVLRPPTLVVQPPSTNVAVNSDVLLSVMAEGSAPLRYQWYLGNDRLFNKTNATLELLNVQTDNAGNYTVVITNTVGSVTSSVATLTITGGTAAPPSLTGASFVEVGAGGNFSLMVATEAGHTYTLQFNSAVENQAGWLPVPGASVAGDGTVKTLTDTTAPMGRRFYRIVVN